MPSYTKLGDAGDCGNYAIAFQQKYGGKLVAMYWSESVDFKPHLDHIVVELNGHYHDSEDDWNNIQDLYESLAMHWGEDNDIWAEKITKRKIFHTLLRTNKERIKWIEDNDKIRPPYSTELLYV